MRNCHFQSAVANGTQRNKVVQDVGHILILIEAPRSQMVDVKASTSRAALCFATSARFVARKHDESNSIPITSLTEALPAAPMRAGRTDHCPLRTGMRTESAALGVPVEGAELPSAALALFGMGSHGGSVLAGARTVPDGGVRMMEALSALLALDYPSMRSPVFLMTLRRTEGKRSSLKSEGWPLKLVAATGAHLGHR